MQILTVSVLLAGSRFFSLMLTVAVLVFSPTAMALAWMIRVAVASLASPPTVHTPVAGVGGLDHAEVGGGFDRGGGLGGAGGQWLRGRAEAVPVGEGDL